ISAFLFGGMTSSGSSYIVQILKVLGLGDVFSVFVTQVFTDYGDKLLAVVLVNLGLNAVPKTLKVSLTGGK
ncbi:ECF transporter S component, partial [Clostridioides difficile]|nr:ECF transporter S component [Clostridioides difficile]